MHFFLSSLASLPPRVDTGRSLHLLRCCFVSLNKVIIMRLDLLKALLADIVLHLAGIFQCNLCRNSKSLQPSWQVRCVSHRSGWRSLRPSPEVSQYRNGPWQLYPSSRRSFIAWLTLGLENAKSGSNINGTKPRRPSSIKPELIPGNPLLTV